MPVTKTKSGEWRAVCVGISLGRFATGSEAYNAFLDHLAARAEGVVTHIIGQRSATDELHNLVGELVSQHRELTAVVDGLAARLDALERSPSQQEEAPHGQG